MTVKFISLNLWHGGRLFPQIIEFLKTENADIIVLQEAQECRDADLPERFHSIDTLQGQLDYPFSKFAEAFVLDLPGGKVSSGNAILSKYLIKQASTVFLFDSTKHEYQDIPEHWPIMPRILQHAALQTPVGELNAFNIHGVWDLDGDNPSEARKVMVERTLQAMEGKPNALLAGDTNATTGNPVLRDIEGQLNSVFRDELVSTFNMRRKDKPGYATAAVDHMYVSPNIKVLSHICPDIDISDHLPLIATLET